LIFASGHAGAAESGSGAESDSALERTRWGTVVADETTGKTTKDRVWAGGDIVTGAATVISAMGAGKRAAADIDRYLNGDSPAR
jgi:glutamate synthase (NADPH/NADH) small chain